MAADCVRTSPPSSQTGTVPSGFSARRAGGFGAANGSVHAIRCAIAFSARTIRTTREATP